MFYNNQTLSRMKLQKLAILFLISGVISFCSQKRNLVKYDINSYVDQPQQDSILTEIIINIYKVPKGVRKEYKRNPEYRKLYISQIPNFQFLKYHIVDSSQFHYFYLIRPARNVHGHKRGVAGRFKLEGKYKLTDFEEIFNTPMISEEDIIEKGEYLWNDLMYFGHVDRYFLNKQYIEFPDELTRYDKIKMEWTYEGLMTDENEELEN